MVIKNPVWNQEWYLLTSLGRFFSTEGRGKIYKVNLLLEILLYDSARLYSPTEERL